MENILSETLVITGSFDRCLTCPYLGQGCSGPRTTAMTFERWLEFIRALKALKKVSNQTIMEGTGLSKNTVDNILAGKQKDVSRTTAGLIEDFLIGSNAKWPCAMDLNVEKNIVYQDRPETLEALENKAKAVEELNKILEDIHNSYKAELDTLRSECQRKVDYLLEQNNQKDRIIDKLLSK